MPKILQIQGLSEAQGAGIRNFSIIKQAIADSINGNFQGLELPEGRYEVYSQKALADYEELLTGKDGPHSFKNEKNILFGYAHVRHYEIIGHDTYLLMDGLMGPFELCHCDDFRIKGIVIDWIHPPFFAADVVEKVGNRLYLFPAEPNRIRGGEPVVSFQTVDLKTGKQGGVSLFTGISPVEYQAGRYSVTCQQPEQIHAGDSLVLRFTYNYKPAFHLYRCKNIVIEDVTLHAAAGMGIIGQKVENINVSGLNVLPSPGRPMSTNTDATHFINCSGHIHFRNCYFEGMGDDAINVHGFYLRIKKVKGKEMWFALEQCCQDGVNYFPDAGQTIEFVSARSLQPYGEAMIQSVEFDNETRSGFLCCEQEIEPIAREGDLIANQTEIARLTFEHCTVRNIRGRAALVQTRGALIDNCLFEGCTGEGIHICTETGWWESIATRDITISNNRFINCGYGKTGYCDAVAVVTSTNAPEQTVGVHRNIKITGNQIIGSGTPALITCAENVLFKDNIIACPQGIEVRNSRNVLIGDNTYSRN